MNSPLQYKDQLRSKRRKKLFLKITFIFLGIIGLSGLIIYLLFFAELFDVRDVGIDGNKITNSTDISEITNKILQDKKWGLPQRLNILFLDTNEIKNVILDSFPRIYAVSVSKKLFHSMNIKISERDPSGIWCVKKENKCVYFDKEGVAFEEAPQLSGLILLHVEDNRKDSISLREKVIDEDWLIKIFEAKTELENRLNIKIKTVLIPAESFDEFHVVTDQGWLLMLTKNLDLPFQIESLKIFINQKLTPEKLKSLQYIDARIMGRFYYK